MKHSFDGISNTQLSELIDEWVRGETARKIMKRRLIDGVLLEPLAEEFGFSERYVRNIVKTNTEIILKQIESKDIRKLAESVPKWYCQTD